MRILHVISCLADTYGGPAKVCRELCEELARQGETVSIFTTRWNGHREDASLADERLRDLGVDLRVFPVATPRGFWFSPRLFRALRESIPDQDIVHTHMLYSFPSTAAAALCRRHGVPYVAQPHGTLDPFMFERHRGRKRIFETLFEWRNLNRASAVQFTAEEERVLASRLGLRLSGIVSPIGLRLSEYDDAPALRGFLDRWPECRGRKRILFLGRLNFKKGLDIVVRAFGEIRRRRDDVVLVLAGPDDGLEQRTRSWLADERAEDRAVFTGMLQGAEKLAAFHESDLFVLPSYSENFAIAMVEAMACARPVVISDKIDLWREVAEAGAGKVVPCDDRQVAQAIVDLLDDPQGSARMGQAGRRLAEQRFHLETVAARTIEVYRGLVAAAAAPGNGRPVEANAG